MPNSRSTVREDFERHVEQGSEAFETFQAFSWFSDGLLFKISENPLKIGDMRFILGYQSLQTPFAMQLAGDQGDDKGQGRRLKLAQMETNASLLLTYTFGPPEKKQSPCRKINQKAAVTW